SIPQSEEHACRGLDRFKPRDAAPLLRISTMILILAASQGATRRERAWAAPIMLTTRARRLTPARPSCSGDVLPDRPPPRGRRASKYRRDFPARPRRSCAGYGA